MAMITCQVCDKTVHKRNRDDRPQKYCSRDCFYKSTQAIMVIRNCKQCGKPFEVPQSQLKKINHGQFCSRSCSMTYYHHKWGHGSITISCPICGTEKTIKKSHNGIEITCGNKECTRQYRWNQFLDRFQKDYGAPLGQVLYTLYIEHHMSYRDISAIANINERTIKKALVAFGIPIRGRSKAIKTQWMNGKHDNQIGEDHYRWQGGNSIHYGISRNDWNNLAETIRHRDNYQCTRCGMTNQDSIKQHNKILAVHHIIPYILSHNNSPNNLRTLCPSCHQIVEQQFIWLL